jgi:hypothetical protein
MFDQNLNERRPSDLQSVLQLGGPGLHQPLYCILVNVVMRFSHSYAPVIQYTTNTLIFLLSAVGVFYIGRFFLPLEGQLYCLVLYALSGQAMAFALQIREYCLILCLVVWNAYFFLRILKPVPEGRSSTGSWLIAGHLVTGILGLYASLWTLFFLFPQSLLAVWNIFRGQKRGWPVLASQFASALCLAPWVLSHASQKINMAKIWDSTPPSLPYLLFRLRKGFEFVLTGNIKHHWLPIIFDGIFVISILATVAYLTSSLVRFRHLDMVRQYITLAFLSFFGFQVGYFFLKEPLSVSPRYFILYLPFTSLGIGSILTETGNLFGRFRIRWSIAVTACLTFVVGAGLLQIVQYYRDPDVDHREDFRIIYNYLETRISPDDDVVVDSVVNAVCLKFYSNSPEQFAIGFATYNPVTGPRPKRVWLVINRRELSVQSELAALKSRLIESGYRFIDQTKVEGTTILHYAIGLPR